MGACCLGSSSGSCDAVIKFEASIAWFLIHRSVGSGNGIGGVHKQTIGINVVYLGLLSLLFIVDCCLLSFLFLVLHEGLHGVKRHGGPIMRPENWAFFSVARLRQYIRETERPAFNHHAKTANSMVLVEQTTDFQPTQPGQQMLYNTYGIEWYHSIGHIQLCRKVPFPLASTIVITRLTNRPFY